MLTEFFSMNSTNNMAKIQSLYYQDFPASFCWYSSQKRWTPRKRGQVVGRLASVNPSEGERYYLRLLLLNVRAPTSYESLLTVDTTIYSTYREAAYSRGLLESDTTFERALEEAASYELPCSLRVLFATILAYCELSNPAEVFKKFFTDLSEDYRKQSFMGANTDYDIHKQVVEDLDKTLEVLGKSINDFHLEDIQVQRDHRRKLTRELRSEYEIPISTDDLTSVDKLNRTQRNIYDKVVEDVIAAKPAAYFVDGPGGTGKTFLYKAILAQVRSLGYIAIATTSSGIASTLLPGGRTAHSRFAIPINSEWQGTTNISKASSAGLLLIECRLIIWDETPMVHKSAIENVNTTLKDFCETDQPFGGKVVLFGGDFRQTLPIVQGASRAETVEAVIAKSELWKHFQIYTLTENMRAKEDPEFAGYLMRIGNGTEPETSTGYVKIPENMIIPYTTELCSIQALIKQVYPDLQLFRLNPSEMCARAILTPKNDAVHQINDILIDQFPGNVVIYKSIDRALNNQDEAHYSDFLNELTPIGMPRHVLALKLYCPVVLLRNINPLMGFANGTRLICTSLDPHVIGVQIVSGHSFIDLQLYKRTLPCSISR